MKSDTGNKIRLGLFVFLGIVVFTVGIYFIGQKQRLFGRTFRIRAIFRNVDGLQPGNNVRFEGINVGNVEKIAILSDTSVEVVMSIDKSVKKFVKKDADASVGSEGLMGDKLLILKPGSERGQGIENNDFVQTNGGNDIDAIMEQVKVTAENAARITGDMAGIINNIHSGKGTVGKLLMDTVFAANLGQTMVNVRQGSRGFTENMDAIKHNILFRGYFKKKEKEKKELQAGSSNTPD